MDMHANERRVMKPYNGVKTFCATLAREREMLGDKVTAWIQGNPDKAIVGTVVTQSSDQEFHCLAITLFFWQGAQAL